MKYLNEIEIFVMKKLLLETRDETKEYSLTDFCTSGFKVIADCLLFLIKAGHLTASNIKIGCDFFERIFSSSDFKDFLYDVDINERSRPTDGGIDYETIRGYDYIGLGEKVFKRYEKECCSNSSILEPNFDLEVSAKELEHIVKRTSSFPYCYGDALFKNLTFSIRQSKKQKEKLENYFKGYLEKFRNDDLERQSATDYYRYAKQKEMIDNTIEHFRENYPIKNLWLRKSDISAHGDPHVPNLNLFKNYNLLEVLLCLEQDGKGEGIKIEALDPQKGIKITDYSTNQRVSKETEEKNNGKEALPIRIVGDVGIKGFEEKVILQKPKNKRIQLRKFPADTKWNDVMIQFLNDHEVIVRVKNETHQTTYEAMGFQDEKKKLPNKQWQFLRLLAFKNGEISWENNRDLSLQQINSIKKQKQLLTEALRAYFQIYKDEPFYDYKKEKAYKIKLSLIAESNTKTAPNEEELFKEDDDLGIKESYKEQTPEIYEE